MFAAQQQNLLQQLQQQQQLLGGFSNTGGWSNGVAQAAPAAGGGWSQGANAGFGGGGGFGSGGGGGYGSGGFGNGGYGGGAQKGGKGGFGGKGGGKGFGKSGGKTKSYPKQTGASIEQLAASPDANPKALLNTFCQKQTKKAVTTTDITYSVAKFGDQHQATVTLACLGGLAFAGELQASAKQAEQYAAQAALAHYGISVRVPEERPKGVPGPPQATNPKSELVHFIQKKLPGQLITKDHIVYSAQKFGSSYQATVSLACLGGLAFAGEVAGTQKQAEQNAAAAALAHHAAEVAALQAAPVEKGKKRKAGEALGVPSAPATNKTKLNSFLGRILKRGLTKEDITCSTVNVGTGFQSTVTLPGMTGKYAGLGWAGEIGASQKAAEDNACAQVIAALEADPELAPIIAGEKPKKAAKTKTKKVAEAKVPGQMANPAGAAAPQAQTSRSILNAAVCRIAKRNVTKEDCSYDTVKVGDQYQSTVSIPALPDHWATLGWAGEVATSQKEAEENAAFQAVQALKLEDSFAPCFEPAKKKASGSKSKKPANKVVAPTGTAGPIAIKRPTAETIAASAAKAEKAAASAGPKDQPKSSNVKAPALKRPVTAPALAVTPPAAQKA